MGGVRYSAEQWSEWIEQQQESGLAISEFCDAIGISSHTFYRWRIRLAEERASSSPRQSPFVPLSLVDRASLEVDLPCGAVMRVPRDESLMRQIVRILLDADAEEAHP